VAEEMTDKPICGYVLADRSVCHELRNEKWCETHELPRFQVCDGCGQPASRECPNRLEPGPELCKSGLCGNCTHQFDDTHGPSSDAFSQQQPDHREAPPELHALRAELVKVVDRLLVTATRDNEISFTGQITAKGLAEKLVDGLATHTVLMSLSAAAMAVPK
jgi:hypothetical protein